LGQPVIITWEISSYFGWGVYGLNLALNWAADPAIESLSALPIRLDQIAIDPLRRHAVEPFLMRSMQFQTELQKFTNGSTRTDVPVLASLGNDFVSTAAAHNVALEGKPTIGVIFFESPLNLEAVERAKRFPLIVAGSSWNERLLRAYGIERVRKVSQGIDPSYFHPAPKLGVLSDRFLVFSGGKAEIRKGQDIVIAAFKIFGERHPEAVLVTAWHSPWPQLARSLDRTRIATPVVFDQADNLNVSGWAAANGIRADQILDVGNVPNIFVPSILREMDVALFTNRSEGGTNLVAMECMACGLPVILSRNTGHLDLIEDGNCYTLDDQRQAYDAWVGIGDDPGWGESQVEEVVERLEQAFTDRAEAKRRGNKACDLVSRFTWAATAKEMKDIVLSAL
jgi:glycosyltransferase involved in cell wall biosynthesis